MSLCTLLPTFVLGTHSLLIQLPGSQDAYPTGLPIPSYTDLPSHPFLHSHTGAQNPISWEVQRFDGWYNNLMEHRWGSKGR